MARDVQYTFEVTDEDLTNIKQESRSVLVDQLNKIKATDVAHGRWVQIASYNKGSAASSAAKSLRDRFGNEASVAGFLFRTKRDEENGRYGLYARYTPDAIVAGAQENWTKAKAAKADAKAAAPKVNEAPKAKAS